MQVENPLGSLKEEIQSGIEDTLVGVLRFGQETREEGLGIVQSLLGDLTVPPLPAGLWQHPNSFSGPSADIAAHVYEQTSVLSTGVNDIPFMTLLGFVLLILFMKSKYITIIVNAKFGNRAMEYWNPQLAFLGVLFSYQLWLVTVSIGQGFVTTFVGAGGLSTFFAEVSAASNTNIPINPALGFTALTNLILLGLKGMFLARGFLLEFGGIALPLLFAGGFTGIPMISRWCRGWLSSLFAIAILMPIPVSLLAFIAQQSALFSQLTNPSLVASETTTPIIAFIFSGVALYFTYKAMKVGTPRLAAAPVKAGTTTAKIGGAGAVYGISGSPRAAYTVMRGRRGKGRSLMQASRARKRNRYQSRKGGG
jgi:hypothetical protein